MHYFLTPSATPTIYTLYSDEKYISGASVVYISEFCCICTCILQTRMDFIHN